MRDGDDAAGWDPPALAPPHRGCSQRPGLLRVHNSRKPDFDQTRPRTGERAGSLFDIVLAGERR